MNGEQPCPYCSAASQDQSLVFVEHEPFGTKIELYVCNECDRVYNLWTTVNGDRFIQLLPSQMKPLVD